MFRATAGNVPRWHRPQSRLAPEPRLRHNFLMSLPGTAEALLEKLRDLPAGKLAEVEDFVDFLRERERRAAVSHAKRLQTAAESGQITPVTPGLERSLVKDVPPVDIPGKPLSEMVLEDRRRLFSSTHRRW